MKNFESVIATQMQKNQQEKPEQLSKEEFSQMMKDRRD